MAEREELLDFIATKLAETPRLAEERTQEAGKPLEQRWAYNRILKHMECFLKGEKPEDIENRVIVLPGLRGVGKTTLLLQLYSHLISEDSKMQERILYFSMDEAKEYLGAKILEIVTAFADDFFKASLVTLDTKLIIMIDEAHFDERWSTAAKIVYDQTKNIFLILTGSSALSMEMSVDLARRARKEIVFPLNFFEYLALKYKITLPPQTPAVLQELLFNPSTRSLHQAKGLWAEIRRAMVTMGTSPEREFKRFLFAGGFPYGIHLDEKSTYERTFSMIDRIIERDIFTAKSFNTETRNLITRIIYYLALKKPGETSDGKLSQNLGQSSRQIRSILDVLEKTHLVFSVKPYAGAGKAVRKSWKYYFASPTLNAAIRAKLGVGKGQGDMLGLLAETLVASSFIRLREAQNGLSGIFYDPEKGGVDLLIRRGEEEIIPVEIGIGEKEAGQIERAIRRYGSKYGIIISNRETIEMKDKVLFLPLLAFSFM